MTPERSEPPPPTWSEFIGNCYASAIIIVQHYDSCLLQMDFYFSFLKAYLMLIITFYRYSFAYAASHFHFDLLPSLLSPRLLHRLDFLSFIAFISVNCAHCGLRHSQFIKIASSVLDYKKRHQCVSSIGIDFLLCLPVFVSRKPENVGFEKLFTFFSSPHLAPCTNKF